MEEEEVMFKPEDPNNGSNVRGSSKLLPSESPNNQKQLTIQDTALDATERTRPKQEGQGQFTDVIQLSMSVLKQYVKNFLS